VGVNADFQRFSLSPQQGSDLPASVIEIGRFHASTAYSFFGDQLSIGAGARAVILDVDTVQPGANANAIIVQSQNVLSMLGVSPEIGMLIRPDYTPWRLGVTYRLPVDASGEPSSTVTRDADGVRRAAGLALPSKVHWPWEVEVGVALSAGPRPLNPQWIDPHEQEAVLRQEIKDAQQARVHARELELSQIPDLKSRQEREAEMNRDEVYIRAEEERRLARLSKQLDDERRARFANWPRARILVVAEVLITGGTSDGIGIQSFLRQEDVQSGGRTSAAPRLGMEGEPVPNVLVARIGTYLEPSRYAAPAEPGVLAGMRQHFTFGTDLHVFDWDVFGIAKPTQWRVTFAGDLAPRYQNIGLGIGTWH
jgi:hypothetical protein